MVCLFAGFLASSGQAYQHWGLESGHSKEAIRIQGRGMVPLSTRYLTQMTTVVDVSAETGSAITIDQIDKGLDTCTNAANQHQKASFDAGWHQASIPKSRLAFPTDPKSPGSRAARHK
jgi:hypothetical protein